VKDCGWATSAPKLSESLKDGTEILQKSEAVSIVQASRIPPMGAGDFLRSPAVPHNPGHPAGCAGLYRKGSGRAPLKPLLHMALQVLLVVYRNVARNGCMQHVD
jgi:hypothetical protein